MTDEIKALQSLAEFFEQLANDKKYAGKAAVWLSATKIANGIREVTIWLPVLSDVVAANDAEAVAAAAGVARHQLAELRESLNEIDSN